MPAPITIDGNMSDWAGVPVLADPKFSVPKGSGTTGGGNYVLFEPYGGGTWSGPDDQTSAVQVAWDVDNVYLGFVVTDDYHENISNNAWNGDSVQLMIANGARTKQVALYNFSLGGYEDAQGNLQESDTYGGVMVELEAGETGQPSPGTPEAVITRDHANHKTIYEIKLPIAALGMTNPLTAGTTFGLGMAINDGDGVDLGGVTYGEGASQQGQKGWGGLGAHSIVIATATLPGKAPTETALITLGSQGPGEDRLFFSAVNPGLSTFSFRATDKGTSIVDPTKVKLTLDGQVVTLVASPKVVDATDFTYTRSSPFPSGSTHNYTIEATDTLGHVVTSSGNFSTITYRTLAATDAAPAGSVSTASGNAGFRVKANQLSITRGTSIAEAEQQLANGYIDPATGLPYDNQLSYTADAEGYYIDPDVVNSGDPAPTSTVTQFGNFTDVNGYPDEPLPGNAVGDNIAAEWLTFLDLKKGMYQMGVNSDDGFKVTAGLNARDPFAASLGQFDGGRGSADTLFNFYVDSDGIYPFRLIWYEGGGDANVEWFMVTPNGKVLINDLTKPADTVKAYAAATAPVYSAYVSSISPWPGSSGVALDSPIKVQVTSGKTALVAGSAKLLVDGNQVNITPTTSGSTTTFTYTPAQPWLATSTHAVSFIYQENTTPATSHTNNFSFTATFGNESFTIEAEDFDYDGGKANPQKGTPDLDVDVMPYLGGAYGPPGAPDPADPSTWGLGAVHDVDYHAADTGSFTGAVTTDYPDGTPDGYVYRTGIPAQKNGPARYVPMYSNTGQATDTQRPGFELTQNYSIGWVGANEWYNYTRNIPEKNYRIFGGFSYGDTAPNRLVADVGIVTAGVGTSNQTVIPLGTFNAPGTGGWGTVGVVPLNGGDGKPVTVHLGGTSPTTVRVTTTSGDFDYVFLVPTTDPAGAPTVTSAFPTPGATLISAASIKVTITDQFRQPVSQGAVKLTVDGTDVTSSATLTRTSSGLDVTYAPSAGITAGSHSYSLDYGTGLNYSGTFTTLEQNPTVFVIEAEDFNYGGGQTKAAASTMPLVAGQYNGLSATLDIDYHRDDAVPDADAYRIGETPNVPEDNGPGDFYRGPFSVSSNYKIGWIGANQWYDYTRTFPAGTYKVYAALSFDVSPGSGNADAPDRLSGNVQLVTAGATTTDQTLQDIGTFTAPGTAGWGVNRLVKAVKTDGSDATVDLSGTQTIRYNAVSGDYDYLLFVKSAGGGQNVTVTVTKSGSQLTITWSGGGKLQSTDALKATGNTWTDVPNGATGNVTVPIDQAKRFYRVQVSP